MEPARSRTLLLLSCSHQKTEDGQRSLGGLMSRSIGQLLPPVTGQQLLENRDAVRKRLAGGPPRIYNEDQKGGFRDERRSNRRLRRGPDFGGDDSQLPVYLPAYARYVGRFFTRLLDINPSFWSEVPTDVEIVFVSALYGLVL
jgi:hypothetical protein